MGILGFSACWLVGLFGWLVCLVVYLVVGCLLVCFAVVAVGGGGVSAAAEENAWASMCTAQRSLGDLARFGFGSK